MKVLIADKFEHAGLDGLKAAGCEVIYQPDATGDALVAAIRATAAPVLVVRSTQVTEAMLDAGPLALIVRAGAGVNTIDVAGASRRGIYVSNCPGKNAVAVAELALGLILALDRRIPDNVADLRAGTWNKKEYSKARGLHGQTLGLIGFGSIGQEVARRARAFGMPVVAWSRRFERDEAARAAAVETFDVEVASTAAEVMSRADIVSVHLALTKDTRGFVNADLLSHDQEGRVLHQHRARRSGRLRGARGGGEGEGPARGPRRVRRTSRPAPPARSPTPSSACPASTARTTSARPPTRRRKPSPSETVRIIRTFKETGRVPNVVNLARQTPATHMLVVRHRDKPGVLAHVFEHLRVRHLNVQETENIIFEGAQAAVARINLDGVPSHRALRGDAGGQRRHPRPPGGQAALITYTPQRHRDTEKAKPIK